MLSTRKVRNEITNNKEGKLTYEKGSEIYTFITETWIAHRYIASYVRNMLLQYSPEILKSHRNSRTEIVTIKFYLRNKEVF